MNLDPCSCGSGKAYRACCGRGRADAAASPEAAFDAAARAYQAREFAIAISLTDAVAPQTTDPKVHYLRGRAFKALKDLDRAQASYRMALELKPGYADAWISLGVALRGQGDLPGAAGCYEQAVALNPAAFEAWINLGNLRLDQRQFENAEAAFLRALEAQPQSWLALHRLGFARHRQGILADAVELYNRALAINPACADCFVHLGYVLQHDGHLEAAMRCYNDALAIQPGNAAALYAKAGLLRAAGDETGANALMSAAVHALPAEHEESLLLGTELHMQGLYAEAMGCFARAVERAPSHALAWSSLGESQRQLGDFNGAVASFERAISLQPDLAPAQQGRALIYLRLGQVEEAVAGFRRARQASPTSTQASSAELLALCYLDRTTPKELRDAHAEFFTRHFVKPSGSGALMPRTDGRRIRIGYVSPNFRQHSVAYFFEPLLTHRNRDKFDVVCYSEHGQRDAITERLQTLADDWRQILGQPPSVVGRTIRTDQIDILIDLAGHTERPPLLFFGRWAPVQATYLGYPTTSGLGTIDYRITDWLVDPAGYEAFNVERPLRLPGSYYCYRPPDLSIAASHFDESAAEVVFGSFNNLAKVSNTTLRMWGQVLRSVSNARLYLKTKGLGDVSQQHSFLARLEASGIEAARVDLAPWKDSTELHLSEYRKVDIALDTFPYNGATTTSEALWMGVPIVTRYGSTHPSRMGLSIVTAAGMPHLAAASEEQFVACCLELAANVAALRRSRTSLRDQLLRSPLTNGPSFVRDFERALEEALAERALEGQAY